MVNDLRPSVWTHVPTAADQAGIAAFVSSLGESRDAAAFNSRFAQDVVWGSPTGYVISGYDELHAIHRRFFQGPQGAAPSRFQLVSAVFASADVAVLHIRRDGGEAARARAPAGGVILHEIALYVLVRVGGVWMLGAAQNTAAMPAGVGAAPK